jgi:hypothetical protein
MKRKQQRPKTPVTPKRKAMDWSRITQTRISAHFGLSREYVNRVITGAYHNPEYFQKIKTLVSGWICEDKEAPVSLLKNLYGGDR